MLTKQILPIFKQYSPSCVERIIILSMDDWKPYEAPIKGGGNAAICLAAFSRLNELLPFFSSEPYDEDLWQTAPYIWSHIVCRNPPVCLSCLASPPAAPLQPLPTPAQLSVVTHISRGCPPNVSCCD